MTYARQKKTVYYMYETKKIYAFKDFVLAL